MATDSGKRGGKAHQLASEIRKAIIEGAFQAGTALRQEELALTYGASRMPIREALQVLALEGLIRLEPNKGAVVSPLDADELRENFEMREAAECLALRLAVPHLTNAQLDEATDIHKKIVSSDPRSQAALNRTFHLKLYAPCSRPRLLAHIAGLHDIAERYLQFTLGRLAYVETSAEEHAAILDACYRRDNAAAVGLLSSHITKAGQVLSEYLASSRK